MKRMRDLGEINRDLPFASAAEVAVVVDPLTSGYLRLEDTLHPQVIQRAKRDWVRLGAPHELVSLDDYAGGGGGPYKMVIFANLLNITPQVRQKLHGRLARERSLALWQYAPGYLDEDRYDVAGIGALTGFDVRPVDRPSTAPAVRLTAARLGAAALPRGAEFAAALPLAPVFEIAGLGQIAGAGDILGVYLAGGDEEGKAALAWKQQAKGWTSVYSALPLLSVEVLRALAAVAGVHLYTDVSETLYVNGDWICLHAAEGGTHTIRLPRPARVESIVRPGLVRLEGASEIVFPLAAGETELFRIHPLETAGK
jgi:hypothetical protein